MSFTLLEKVLGSGNAEPLSATSRTVTRLIIQAKRGNSNALQIAPGSFVTGKGIELVKPTADATLSGLDLTSSERNGIDLSQWYIIGTSGEGVNMLIDEF